MIDATQEALKEFGTGLLKVINQIDAVRDALLEGKKWNDGEWLSQAQVKLSVLNSYLGEHIDRYGFDKETFSTALKAMQEQIKLDELAKPDPATKKMTTATKADSIKIIRTQDEAQEVNQRNYQYSLLRHKRDDVSEMIDTVRSRLSWLKTERTENRL